MPNLEGMNTLVPDLQDPIILFQAPAAPVLLLLPAGKKTAGDSSPLRLTAVRY